MEIKYVTPIGELIYPHINREDPKFGKYKTIFKLSMADAKEFIEQCHNLAKDEFRTVEDVQFPFVVNADVAEVEIKASSKYVPVIVDASAQLLIHEEAPEIYGGTKAKLKLKLKCTEVTGKKYVSAYLGAVQIIELASIPSGFEAVEGFNSAKEEQQSEPAASDFDKYQVTA